MKILAIDPGAHQSALLEWINGQIANTAILPNEEVLKLLRSPSDQPTRMVIEGMQSYGMAVGKEVFDALMMAGRFIEAWYGRGGRPWQIVYRSQIKIHHCNARNAKDSNIRAALINKYGKPGTKKEPGLTYPLHHDLWSAFAIATYVTETENAQTVS